MLCSEIGGVGGASGAGVVVSMVHAMRGFWLGAWVLSDDECAHSHNPVP
jgi:hypothetical protein